MTVVWLQVNAPLSKDDLIAAHFGLMRQNAELLGAENEEAFNSIVEAKDITLVCVAHLFPCPGEPQSLPTAQLLAKEMMELKSIFPTHSWVFVVLTGTHLWWGMVRWWTLEQRCWARPGRLAPTLR